jgi:hypothetical protein
MSLEELELFFASATVCDYLHDGFQLWICACSCCQHVDDRIRRRRRGRGGWRRLLYRLGGWWTWLGLLVRLVSTVVLCVLVGLAVLAVLAMVWP